MLNNASTLPIIGFFSPQVCGMIHNGSSPPNSRPLSSKKLGGLFISTTYDSSTYGPIAAQIFQKQSQNFWFHLFFIYFSSTGSKSKPSLDAGLASPNFHSLFLCIGTRQK